tara:strand:- start:17 stop:355 length:339 start_codon:yes stop_codon:yes gene_type:complete
MEKYTQKLFIDKVAKSKDVTIIELATELKLKDSSLRVTLIRNNLTFNQFCIIYKYIYKSEFIAGAGFFNDPDQRELNNEYPLKSFIEMMEKNDTPVIVTLYKKTKIQLINPI